MHPLALWLANATQFRERDRENRLLLRQRVARGNGEELGPLERDGRWAAAMHRWAEQERAARAREVEAQPDTRSAAQARSAAQPRSATNATTPGCATA